VVFAGTNSGLLRSLDGGATWDFLANAPDVEQVGPVVVDPRDSDSIYLFADSNSNAGVFASQDGGDTWVKLEGCGFPVWDLKFVRVGADYWLYAATMNGLRYLKAFPDDPTAQWEYGSGLAGVATIDAFDAGVEEGRVVYYIGTSGGDFSSITDFVQPKADTATTQNMAGGVYRSMVVTTNLIYLPLVTR
jgi:photosystem II stability/assembly factor-like uncharacterized protein